MSDPGTCPSCGADWRVGPRSRALAGIVRCHCATAVGGVHPTCICRDCDTVRLSEHCADEMAAGRGRPVARDLARIFAGHSIRGSALLIRDGADGRLELFDEPLNLVSRECIAVPLSSQHGDEPCFFG